MSEKLIYAMSTRDSFSLDRFNEMFRLLHLPAGPDTENWPDIDARRYLIRLLDSLCYCEFDFNRRMVHMCPPCLVLLPVCGLPRAVLAGARSPRLLKGMKSLARKSSKRASVESVLQKGGQAAIPPSIYIEAASSQMLREIAAELEIGALLEGPASWMLANFSASVNDVKKGIAFEKRAAPGWKRRVFDQKTLSFSYSVAEKDAARLSLVEYTNPVNKQFRHWLWDGEAAAEVDRDWGRYLALADAGLNILTYDPDLRVMAVPVTVPPPCLLARSLAMCSGAAPRIIRAPSKRIGDIPPGSLLHVYECVAPSIAGLVSMKLGQELISGSLINNSTVVSND
ncbi:MAG: hypothetical protein AB1512_02680 [Thermodesulfobacteriota bacterium]